MLPECAKDFKNAEESGCKKSRINEKEPSLHKDNTETEEFGRIRLRGDRNESR